jgi:hypothetical protein
MLMTARLKSVGYAALLAASVCGAALAGEKKYDTGATDTEIKIGNTMPYSGQGSAWGLLGKAEAAYFDKVNAEGGINGRTIRFISYDDAYSPPKTVEQTRRLVENDEVLLLFSMFGVPTNTAIHKYVNAKKIPHLFVGGGGSKWNDPRNFPWTMAFQPSFLNEGRVYGQYLAANHPDGKIAVLYQHDDYGKDILNGLKQGLDDYFRGELRGVGTDDRFPGRAAQGQRRRRLHELRRPEIRRSGDPEDRRTQLETGSYHQYSLSIDRERDPAGRLRHFTGNYQRGIS